MEYRVILHTAAGDVTTSYGADQLYQALACAASYAADGKSFTLTNVAR